MPARVIHFGPDDCHRLMVLRSAGYTVVDCQSLGQLRDILDTGEAPDAVLMSDAEDVAPSDAIAVARQHSTQPVVLFRNSHRAYEDLGCDLVVPCLTPPEVWLNEVDALIEKRRVAMRR
jgi:hypothetical protein